MHALVEAFHEKGGNAIMDALCRKHAAASPSLQRQLEMCKRMLYCVMREQAEGLHGH